MFAIPAVIFLTILGWLDHLRSLPTGTIVFSKFIPIAYIEATFVTAIGLSLIGATVGGVRYWKAMIRSTSVSGNGPSRGRHLGSTLLEIFKHAKFRACGDAVGNRETHKEHLHGAHLAVFYGFLGLVITTASVGVGIYAFGYLTPWPFWHPVKILGNVSGIVVIVALTVFLWRRIADKTRAGKSTYSDWLFLAVLLLTTLTGFASQGLRLADVRLLAYPMYFVHLVFIFFLLAYIPYSKFAHLVYRTIAMLHTACAGSSGAT